jgi:hypothetical protein
LLNKIVPVGLVLGFREGETVAQASGKGKPGVFISYRREDAGYAPALLSRGLISHFGQERIFLDVASIHLGQDFIEQITAAVESCAVLLAVIGPTWAATLNQRRSDGSLDYVQVEIGAALSRGITVIPVLLDGAEMPDASQLPDNLLALASKQAHEVRSTHFDKDLATLLQDLDSELAPPGPPSPQAQAAEDLAEVVRKQWDKETGLRWFHQGVQLLHVSWQPAAEGFEEWDDLIRTADENTPAESSDWAATSAGLAGSDYREICAVLDQVPTGRLVVLGQPGAGKTMLLIQLLQGLLSRRQSGDAVPVLVSLASWRPEIENLHTWLYRRLAIDYPILRARVPGQKISYGRALLDEHKILLLLDGLDEIPAEDRPTAIRLINAVLKDHPEGLVLSCRRKEYLEAAEPAAVNADEPAAAEPAAGAGPSGVRAEVLRGAAGIVLQPLEPADVARYLVRGAPNRQARADWEPVTSKLGPGTEVGQVLTTPLNVTLAHAIYNDPDWEHREGPVLRPADLLTYPTAEKIKEQLYETFIRAAYRPDDRTREPRELREKRDKREKPPPPPPPPLDDAQRWLIFLAQQPGLAWWDLRRSVASWLAPLAIGLICGIAAFIAAATGAHDGVGIGVNLGAGMIAGLVFGLPFRFLGRDSGSDSAGAAKAVRAAGGKPAKADDIKPMKGVSGGFVGAIVGGLAAGIASSHGFGHTASPVSGLPVALGVGLGVGASTTFVGGLVGGLTGGFTAGILEGVGTGLPAGIVNGIGIALVVAVIVRFVGRDTPAAERRWFWPMGLSGGLIIGGAVGIIAGFKESLMIGLILGAAVGVTAAWPTGLLGIKVGSKEIASPGAALSRDARAFWTTALSAGFAAAAFAFVGDGMASIFEVNAKFSFPLLVKDGLGVGLSAGIVVGFVFGAYHATSPSFVIARVWLWLRRELPWGFMAFLADAHTERGVLRENGAVYEFRHLEIADYLARLGAAEAAKHKPRPPAPARAYAWRPSQSTA